MLRRYLSLAFPVMLSAVAGLTYLHFRQAAAVLAAGPRQVAQADPADPFAPTADPAPAVKPVDPAPVVKTPAQTPPVKRGKREVPRNDDEVRTPFLRHLLGQLDGFDEASDEDKDGVRKMIYEADIEMSESMGPNARRAIEAANRRRGAFVVGPRGPRTATEAATKRSDFLKAQRAKAPLRETPPRETTPTPPTTPVPPADPAAPKKDVFDDLFKKE